MRVSLSFPSCSTFLNSGDDAAEAVLARRRPGATAITRERKMLLSTVVLDAMMYTYLLYVHCVCTRFDRISRIGI